MPESVTGMPSTLVFPKCNSEEAVNGIDAGDEVSVKFDTGEIQNLTKGTTYQATPFPEFIQNIIASGGLLASIQKEKSEESGEQNEL